MHAAYYLAMAVETGKAPPFVAELAATLQDRHDLLDVEWEMWENTLKTGDIVTIDLDAATVTVKATGKVFKFKALGDVRPVVDAGGLFNYARKSGMIPASK